MPERDKTGKLGLPRGFSESPEQRRQEIWMAFNVGYNGVNRRFGKLAAQRWSPSASTVLIFDTTEAFIARIIEDSPSAPQVWKDQLVKKPPMSRTLYANRTVYVDGSAFVNPLEVAHNAAHETIHAWVGKQPIKFTEVPAAKFGQHGDEALNYLESQANELILDFCAFESLGLLKPPITRLEPRRLMLKAYNALALREMADGLRPNTEDILFRITQGKFTAAEVASLNRRMKRSPLNPQSGGFYEYGFLLPVACTNSEPRMFKPGFTQHLMIESLGWIAASLGRTTAMLKYIGRPDFNKAENLLVNHYPK